MKKEKKKVSRMKMNCETIGSILIFVQIKFVFFFGLKLHMNLFYRFCICMAASAKG